MPGMRLPCCAVLGIAMLSACGGSTEPPTTPGTTPATTLPSNVPAPVRPLEGASLANLCSGDSWQFDWSDVQASAYHLQVFSPSGATVLDLADVAASLYTWTAPPLVADADRRGWKWRVQANVGGAWRDWSREVAFEVDPPSPRLILPAAGAIADNGCRAGDDGIAWDFEWSACRGAERYHLFVIGPSATIPVVDDDRLGGTTYAHRARAFVAGANAQGWTWRVQARADGEWLDWSAPATFSVEPPDTDCAALAAPELLAPPDGAVFGHFPRAVTLEWAALPNAASYTVEIETCQNPACVEGATNANRPVSGVTGTSYSFNFVGAQPGRWRVFAVNGAGTPGSRSAWRHFRFTV